MAIDEVKVHTSGSTSANVLIYKIAQERGFYKEEKLNVLTIAATSSAGIQGLVGGSFDFSQILGQTSAAILHGAPLKNVMVFDTRPLFWFFGSKKIKRVQDLKGGKLVGVSSLGANTDQMTREILAMNGIDPRKDVVIQGTGTGADTLGSPDRRQSRRRDHKSHREHHGAQARAERAFLLRRLRSQHRFRRRRAHGANAQGKAGSCSAFSSRHGEGAAVVSRQ